MNWKKNPLDKTPASIFFTQYALSSSVVHSYRTHAIITHSFYILNPLFEGHKLFFTNFWTYIWLVFKSGL